MILVKLFFKFSYQKSGIVRAEPVCPESKILTFTPDSISESSVQALIKIIDPQTPIFRSCAEDRSDAWIFPELLTLSY